MTEGYVPYEALARAEADDIADNLPSALVDISAERLGIIKELIADGYAKGLEAGFAMSDFAGTNPASLMDAYNAGIEQGKRELRGEK